MTEIVNIKHDPCDEYCGRGSIFGNPFEIGRDGSREEVIDKYNKYFNFLLKDQRFVKILKTLKGKKLGCFCKEKDRKVKCHLDIVKEYLDKL